MKTGSELQRDVLAELSWEPSVDAAAIGVAVHEGVVTLSGHVRSYAEKRAAVNAARRVAGVQGVADDLVVKLPTTTTRDDTDIAEVLTRNLGWNALLPGGAVQATVNDGWVTLQGEVEWKYQRAEAEKSVAHIAGVKGVTNLIHIKPLVTPTGIAQQIHDAFRRHAETDADQIFAETAGGKVILRGKVRTWGEYEDAEWAAWSAPGVTQVENHLQVKVVEPAVL